MEEQEPWRVPRRGATTPHTPCGYGPASLVLITLNNLVSLQLEGDFNARISSNDDYTLFAKLLGPDSGEFLTPALHYRRSKDAAINNAGLEQAKFAIQRHFNPFRD